ncbi:endolytic transglycosylase MltG [Pseudoxanthomonas dokdonensis]|uniref:Endolytic murein transglycosylase n=1 Tax=Pseudoxanthomonas dokdonensis TaxID=344882 RepID=A0A0R0CMQ8_9GAMM|nr:endolytic transglycosylase MltG [Pseudoxanthomonas dokdonensis]KRG70859.1 aminodeoxychorismate lyase [Pseudoxanthomonas dokdonensis]
MAALLVLLVVAIVAAWGWHRYAAFSRGPLATVAPHSRVTVAPGDSFRGMLARMRGQGVSQGSDLEWLLLGRQLDAAGKLKVGEYALEPDDSPRELLLRMRNGKTIQYRFTIVEGWNIRQLRAAINRASPLKHLSAEMDDAALMTALGHAGEHPEGRFLPETYLYTSSDSDLDVLKRAHAAMQKALAAAWKARQPGLPLVNADEALVLASIIEKETGLASERPAIAGVFVRRLEQGMKLQTDPTVIYGIGSGYDGNIRRRDLVTDTPYNTYTRFGLPPTPIAMPGVDALQAAVRPQPGKALYFVAVGDGSGRHVFSDSLSAHNTAVSTYLRTRRQTLQQAGGAAAPQLDAAPAEGAQDADADSDKPADGSEPGR